MASPEYSVKKLGAILLGIVVVTPLLCSAQTETVASNVTNADYTLKPLSLPGANGVVVLDYFAYDAQTGRLWVPASNTGSVDVIDETTDVVSQVTGFNTGEVELRGRKITLGPTAITVGNGVVYIGNRGDSTLCIIDAHTLKRGECLQVASVRLVQPLLPMVSSMWPPCASCGSPPARRRWASPQRISRSKCMTRPIRDV